MKAKLTFTNSDSTIWLTHGANVTLKRRGDRNFNQRISPFNILSGDTICYLGSCHLIVDTVTHVVLGG